MHDHDHIEPEREPDGANGRYTRRSDPPRRERPQRRSRWTDLFEECRATPKEWRLVLMPFAESSARQIASDIRNGFKRDPEKSRLRGLRSDERWDAFAAPERVDFNDEHGSDLLCDVGPTNAARWCVWLMFLGADVPR